MTKSGLKSNAMQGYTICPDVVFFPQNGGVLASNHRAHTHVWLSISLFCVLAGADGPGPMQAANRTRFTLIDGLLADPTCVDSGEFEPIDLNDVASAMDFLARHMIVMNDRSAYFNFFQKKSSLLDKGHAGTFHQQLGVELLLKQKKDPGLWWSRQKFDDQGKIRNNLYKFVQEAFLERFLVSSDLKGKTVLDFGCGSGMASRRFVQSGARVIGVDPDERLLKEAEQACKKDFLPVLMKPKEADSLAGLQEQMVDIIWLADVFLFYFYPMDGGQPWMPPDRLLARLARNLAPGGELIVSQTHGFFWLAPWLGDPEHPYTVINEYTRKTYSVVPGLKEISQAIKQAGLAITHIEEVEPDPAGLNEDPKAYNFAANFPLWWAFTCQKM